MLERLGYQVIPAENGQHALAIYRNQKDRIDLVILDMIMPDMSGRETYQQLQQIDPQVKVLLYSGHSMDEDVHLVLEKGALGFIQKPYRIANLSQKIADLLQKPPATPRLLPLDRESGTVVQMKRVGQQ
jgi:CheY-like chemotaxis protein